MLAPRTSIKGFFITSSTGIRIAKSKIIFTLF